MQPMTDTLPKPVAISLNEGDVWTPFEREKSHLKGFSRVHAVKFADGSTWDTYNGWRHVGKPRYRVKAGSSPCNP